MVGDREPDGDGGVGGCGGGGGGAKKVLGDKMAVFLLFEPKNAFLAIFLLKFS